MLIVIYGGSGSGKSEYAEHICVTLNKSQLYYIATMQPFDEESLLKIDRHRQMRSEKAFETIECYTNIKTIEIKPKGTVLLECMSNLVANEMFSENGANVETFETIKCGITSLTKQAENLIIVTNNVFDDGVEYDSDTKIYLETLAKVNQFICSIADKVVEVVHGIDLTLKNTITGD